MAHCRSRVDGHWHVTSAKYEYSVTIEGPYATSTTFLALSSDSQFMLVCHHRDRKFHVYGVKGPRITTKYVNEQLMILGAVWTHRNRIVHAALYNNVVIILVSFGYGYDDSATNKTHTIAGEFRNIEASADHSVQYICVSAAKSTTIYQSMNEGRTWSAVISSPEGRQWRYATCTSQNCYDGTRTEFWTVELDARTAQPSLVVYTIELAGSKRNYFNVILPEGFNSQLLLQSKIIYDGVSSLLMADTGGSQVHVWSVIYRKYDRVLVSSQQLRIRPYGLAVSKRNDSLGLRLYVIEQAEVRVFTLAYGYRQ